MKVFKGFFIGTLLLTCLLSCESNQDVQTIDVDSQLDSIFQKHQLMGLSVLLFEDANKIVNYHRGWAHLSKGISISSDTKYRIASISKFITAIAVMQLVEKGELELDRDVNEYLGWDLRNPKFPEISITLDHLMSHRSGIRDGNGYSVFSRNMVAEKLNIQDLLTTQGSYFTPDMFAENAPGTYFSYTNCTWGIIAAIIEKVSGKRFDVYCKNAIFDPMGLNASFNVLDLNDLEELAALYRYQDSSWVSQVDDFSEEPPSLRHFENYQLGQNGLLYGPQGSLRCSANDLFAFAQMIFDEGSYNNQQILSPASIENLLKTRWKHYDGNGDTWGNFFLAYGYGTHILTNTDSSDIVFPSLQMVGHPGIAYGLLSDLYFDVSSKKGVVFITNGSQSSFEYGNYTTFYKLEEEVFGVLNSLIANK